MIFYHIKLIANHLFFYSSFFIWTISLFIFSLPLLLAPRSLSIKVARLWVRGILLFAKVFLRITMNIQGTQYLPQKGPYVVACKHQSVWETLALTLILDNPAFFLKKSLLYFPVVGLFLRKLRMIPVSRTQRNIWKSKAYTLSFQEKRPLVIFPEGTRTAPGTTKRYHHGVYALYHELNLTVIPAALNSGCFWQRRGFFKFPGTIEMVFLPPLKKGLSKYDYLEALSHAIEVSSSSLFEKAQRFKRSLKKEKTMV